MFIVQYHENGKRWKIGEFDYVDEAIKFAMGKVDNVLRSNTIYVYESTHGSMIGYAYLTGEGADGFHDARMQPDKF